VDAALGIGRQFDHGEHRLIAGEDMGVDAGGELAGDALAEIGQRKEVFGHGWVLFPQLAGFLAPICRWAKLAWLDMVEIFLMKGF